MSAESFIIKSKKKMSFKLHPPIDRFLRYVVSKSLTSEILHWICNTVILNKKNVQCINEWEKNMTTNSTRVFQSVKFNYQTVMSGNVKTGWPQTQN